MKTFVTSLDARDRKDVRLDWAFCTLVFISSLFLRNLYKLKATCLLREHHLSDLSIASLILESHMERTWRFSLWYMHPGLFNQSMQPMNMFCLNYKCHSSLSLLNGTAKSLRLDFFLKTKQNKTNAVSAFKASLKNQILKQRPRQAAVSQNS